MKTIKLLSLAGTLLLPFLSAQAGQILAEFEDVDNFTDFSVSGLSEEKTLSIFESELEDELARFARKYIPEGQTLHILFTDIDMAGDIQPWRNRHNADIRYIERVYPPRLAFTYKLVDAEENVLAEGEESIADLAFDYNVVAPMKTISMSFFYETNLLGDWIRLTMRKLQSVESGE
ncbi:MAG: DUF3016 domain-containing protein [Puniceicoccaceae bacterium]